MQRKRNNYGLRRNNNTKNEEVGDSMFSSNDKISNRQLKRMLIFDMFSISCLIIPYIAVKSAADEGILLMVFGTMLAFLYGSIMYFFMKEFNKEGIVVNTRIVQGDGKYPFYEKQGKTIQASYLAYAKKSVGSFVTGIFCILYLAKTFLLLTFSVTLFTSVIGDTLLADMNPKIILAVLLAIAGYGGVQGIEKRARFTEVVYFLVLIPIVLYLLLGLPKIDISNLVIAPKEIDAVGQDFFRKDKNNFLWGSYLILLTYSILESLLFIMPYVKNNLGKNKKIFHYILQGILVVSILNLFIYIITVGVLGVGETSKKFWSVVTIMQIIELPGGFINRQDGIMLSFWVLSIYAILSAFFFYLVYITKGFIQLCVLDYFPNVKTKKGTLIKDSFLQSRIHWYLILFYGILTYFFSTSIVSIEEEFVNFGKYLAYVGIPQSLLIPFIILIFSRLRKKSTVKRGVSNHEQ